MAIKKAIASESGVIMNRQVTHSCDNPALTGPIELSINMGQQPITE